MPASMYVTTPAETKLSPLQYGYLLYEDTSPVIQQYCGLRAACEFFGKKGASNRLRSYIYCSRNLAAALPASLNLNNGTSIWTPACCNPYYRDPEYGTPNFRKPPICCRPKSSTPWLQPPNPQRSPLSQGAAPQVTVGL